MVWIIKTIGNLWNKTIIDPKHLWDIILIMFCFYIPGESKKKEGGGQIVMKRNKR